MQVVAVTVAAVALATAVDMLAVATAEAVVQYTVDTSAVATAAEMDTGATPTEDGCQRGCDSWQFLWWNSYWRRLQPILVAFLALQLSEVKRIVRLRSPQHFLPD